MKLRKSCSLWLAGAVIALLASVTSVKAANPQNLDIHVSISNSKDLTVDSTFYNFGALPVSSAAVTSAAITVTNPSSTGLIETYTIKGDTATADAGGVNWVLAASSGTDQYAMSAQFSNSAPALDISNWGSDSLNSTSAVTATSAVLGNGTPAESGAAVSPSATRKLWFRITTPDVVSDPGHHKAVVVLSVL